MKSIYAYNKRLDLPNANMVSLAINNSDAKLAQELIDIYNLR